MDQTAKQAEENLEKFLKFNTAFIKAAEKAGITVEQATTFFDELDKIMKKEG